MFLAYGALALSPTDVFAQPPHRPSRSERRSQGDGGVSHLVQSLHRTVAQATDASLSWLPRISRYPY